MASFCKQCSIDHFGEDFGDLKSLVQDDGLCTTICEGCGWTDVNASGECVKSDCFRKHGKAATLSGTAAQGKG